ncbi:hypothetical protein [Arthrobacter sp. SX1312]|uniref:hypothetical protein n=1 Tax=Arthrobacter sp. SX1312 TaxID=2058896 RepID=UPI0011B00681|nr:hypothetical protein [Arthrobacter sp. SX1312]
MGNRLAVGVVAATVLLIGGCTAEPGTTGSPPAPEATDSLQQSIAESEIRGGLPAEAIIGEQPPRSPGSAYPFPRAGWLDGGDTFAIVLVGSGSCPAFPSSIEVVGPHTVKVGIDRHEATVCSADMSPRTYVISTPTEIDRTQDVTLTYGEAVVTLPAL